MKRVRGLWPADLQQRFESSETGRALISAFLIVTLIGVLATNMPAGSQLRAETLRAFQPFINAVGLDQTWSVFAPDPRRTSIGMYARVRYADGTTERWELPHGDRFIGEYWDYRWRKWMENLIQDGRKDQMWQPAAQFIARQERDQGRVPVEITLVRRWQELLPPGVKGPDRGNWQEFGFYTFDVRRGQGRANPVTQRPKSGQGL